ncbi:MAG: SIR2 family protein [archaeon]|nr:MAG: SIR2 family protein [archaeon]
MSYGSGPRVVPIKINVPEQKQAIQHLLTTSIKQGTFTPFLGAGVSASSPSSVGLYFEIEPGSYWATVQGRFQTLESALGKGNETTRKYIQSLAMNYRIRSQSQGVSPRMAKQTPIVNFQLKIAKLASALIAAFAAGVSREQNPGIDSDDYSVEMSEGEQERIVGPLFDAVEASLALVLDKTRSGGKPRRLETSIIYKRMGVITCKLLSSKVWGKSKVRWIQNDQSKQVHEAKLPMLSALYEECNPFKENQVPHMRLSLIQWLGDLLWYTMRFDIPAYPSSSELAFLASLLLDTEDLPRRAALAEGANALGEETLFVEHLKNWLKYCEGDEHQSTTDFHRDIAELLVQEFKTYEWNNVEGKQEGGLYPIAFTTNYDRCLEIALSDQQSKYHVIYPVLERNRPDQLPDTKWLVSLGIPSSDGPREVVKGVLSEVKDERGFRILRDDDSGSLQVDVQGPIIVKLHGSPLHPVQNARQEPFLVLSEASYLLSMVGPQGYPQFLNSEMSESRRQLWFLGYSLSDWNVRLSLYRQAHEHFINKPSNEFRNTMNRKIDAIKSALLGTLQVRVYLGDLEELGKMIEHSLLSGG